MKQRLGFLAVACLMAIAHAALAVMPEHQTRILSKPLFMIGFLFGPILYMSLPVLCLAGLWFGMDRVTQRVHPGQSRAWWGYPVLAASLLVGFVWFTGMNVFRHAFWPLVAVGLVLWHGLERAAGRPGLSLRRIAAGLGGWRRWVVPIALLVLFWWAASGLRTSVVLTLAYLNPPELGSSPYADGSGKDPSVYTLAALRRFPDAQSCLMDSANADRPDDLVQLDWDRIEQDSEANVCLFRLLAALGSMDGFTRFAEAQGFKVSSSGFNPEDPFVEQDGSQRVTAHWSIRDNGPRYPTTGLVRYLLAVPYAMKVDATWAADGKTLLAVRIGFNTL